MSKKTPEDPTGQGSNRKRATRRFNRRLKSAKKQVLRLFSRIPRERRTVAPIANTTVYDYDVQQPLDAEIRSIIDNALQTSTDQPPVDWWYSQEVELPYRQGTIEATQEFNQGLEAAIIAGLLLASPATRSIEPDSVIAGRVYRQRLRSVIIDNYNSIKGLSTETATQLINRINSGIRAGKTPTDIKADITGRFDVADSKAKRIVVTEVNTAYNNARMNVTKDLSQVTGVKTAVRHISALLPTTREWHAARHRKIYTVEDQRQWWDSDSNRINCHCVANPVFLDSKNNPLTI